VPPAGGELLFDELLAAAPGLADDLAEAAVGVGCCVEDDRLELAEVDLALLVEDARVGAHVDDLADEDAVFEADDLALEGEGILVDDGSVHVRTRGRGESNFGDLVGDLVGADGAEVVGLGDGAHIGETDGEGAGLLKIVGGLVLGEADDNLVVVVLPGPCGHHHVGNFVLVPGGDHHAGLGSGHKGVRGAEILAACDFADCVAHAIGVFLVLRFGGAGGDQCHCGCEGKEDSFHIAQI